MMIFTSEGLGKPDWGKMKLYENQVTLIPRVVFPDPHLIYTTGLQHSWLQTWKNILYFECMFIVQVKRNLWLQFNIAVNSILITCFS